MSVNSIRNKDKNIFYKSKLRKSFFSKMDTVQPLWLRYAQTQKQIENLYSYSSYKTIRPKEI